MRFRNYQSLINAAFNAAANRFRPCRVECSARNRAANLRGIRPEVIDPSTVASQSSE